MLLVHLYAHSASVTCYVFILQHHMYSTITWRTA